MRCLRCGRGFKGRDKYDKVCPRCRHRNNYRARLPAKVLGPAAFRV
jgi:DNA-directed RNA polymerase subunit RPC12/RpoP